MKHMRKNRSMGITGKAVVRRLRAARRLPRAKRALSVSLAGIAASAPAILLIGLIAGLRGAGFLVLLSICAALFGAVLLSLLSVALLSAIRADLRTANGRYTLFVRYMRARHLDTLSVYRPHFLEREEGEALLSDVERYAKDFVLAPDAFDALASSEGDIDDVALRILAPYIGLLEYLSRASDGECRQYLAARQAARRAIKRWCRCVFPRYASPHYPLLAQNASFVLQTLAERHLAYTQEDGAELLRTLLEEALFYRDPERGGERRLIPRRSRYRAFSRLTRRIAAFPVQELSAGMGGERISEYAALLDEYDAYAARYTLYGCEPLDSAQGRRHCEDAVKDASTCFKCGLDYNGRHRAVCRRCGHYICPDCGSCYCEKLITHDMAHAAFRCE